MGTMKNGNLILLFFVASLPFTAGACESMDAQDDPMAVNKTAVPIGENPAADPLPVAGGGGRPSGSVDLFVAAIGHTPYLSRLPDRISVGITNLGSAPAIGPFRVQLLIDGTLEHEWWVSRVGAMRSIVLRTTTASVLGSRTVTIIVDVDNTVHEYDESNNTYTTTITTGEVKLGITDISMIPAPVGDVPSQVRIDEPITFRITVSNLGSVDSTEPFYVSVTPGTIDRFSYEIEPFVMRVTDPIGRLHSIVVEHTVDMLIPGGWMADVDLNVSIGMPDYVYVNGLDPTRSRVGKGFYVRGMWNGLLYDFYTEYVELYDMMYFVLEDPFLEWYRKMAARVALNEMGLELCGSDARSRYWAEGLWCSEFVRWVYLMAGMDSLCYPYWPYVLFPCWVSLASVDTTPELVNLFDSNGSFLWANRGEVWRTSARTGDYVAMTTNNTHKNHSAIIVAMYANREEMWIAQGSADDCVWYQRRSYYSMSDGGLAGDIDGIGVLEEEYFSGPPIGVWVTE